MSKINHITCVDDFSIDILNDIFSSQYNEHTSFVRRSKKPLAISIFDENSTRTRLSFEKACKNLSVDFLSFDDSNSSIKKGETMDSNIRTILSYNPDILIFRTKYNLGYCNIIEEIKRTGLPCSVVNAGDGKNEHPTQSLIDLLTIKDSLGLEFLTTDCLKEIKFAICGDITHSRVAKSNIKILSKLGASIIVVVKKPFISDVEKDHFVSINSNIQFISNIKDLQDIQPDFIEMLRYQKERFSLVMQPAKSLILTDKIASNLKGKIMHPGPINDGLEISKHAAYGNKSLILKQVDNGIKVRQGLLAYLLLSQKSQDKT